MPVEPVFSYNEVESLGRSIVKEEIKRLRSLPNPHEAIINCRLNAASTTLFQSLLDYFMATRDDIQQQEQPSDSILSDAPIVDIEPSGANNNADDDEDPPSHIGLELFMEGVSAAGLKKILNRGLGQTIANSIKVWWNNNITNKCIVKVYIYSGPRKPPSYSTLPADDQKKTYWFNNQIHTIVKKCNSVHKETGCGMLLVAANTKHLATNLAKKRVYSCYFIGSFCSPALSDRNLELKKIFNKYVGEAVDAEKNLPKHIESKLMHRIQTLMANKSLYSSEEYIKLMEEYYKNLQIVKNNRTTNAQLQSIIQDLEDEDVVDSGSSNMNNNNNDDNNNNNEPQ